MENLSQWFDLSMQKPWEPGVYELKGGGIDGAYSWWNGRRFMYTWVRAFGIKHAFHSRGDRDQVSWFPSLTHWRGLSHPPIEPKHLARRTDPQTSKDAALRLVESGIASNHCNRIHICLLHYGPQNANEVAEHTGLHAHQVLKRFSDLHKMKKASRTGEVRQGQSVWNAI